MAEKFVLKDGQMKPDPGTYWVAPRFVWATEYETAQARIAQIEAGATRLIVAMRRDSWPGKDHGYVNDLAALIGLTAETPEAMHARIVNETADAIARERGLTSETPVSTLCAVCDQIKELHPGTHPWTPKASVSETPVRRAHSKSEYKRLTTQGVECLPPENSEKQP